MFKGEVYCSETTLHGFQYLPRPGLFSHILWVVTIIAAVTLAIVYGLVDNINLYLQAGKNTEYFAKLDESLSLCSNGH